jgi:hypothetical protein
LSLRRTCKHCRQGKAAANKMNSHEISQLNDSDVQL